MMAEVVCPPLLHLSLTAVTDSWWETFDLVGTACAALVSAFDFAAVVLAGSWGMDRSGGGGG